MFCLDRQILGILGAPSVAMACGNRGWHYSHGEIVPLELTPCGDSLVPHLPEIDVFSSHGKKDTLTLECIFPEMFRLFSGVPKAIVVFQHFSMSTAHRLTHAFALGLAKGWDVPLLLWDAHDDLLNTTEMEIMRDIHKVDHKMTPILNSVSSQPRVSSKVLSLIFEKLLGHGEHLLEQKPLDQKH